MLKVWLDGMYLKAVSKVRKVLQEERGDTNFISILIILGIVILLAGVFIGFKDRIIDMVSEIVDGFTIE